MTNQKRFSLSLDLKHIATLFETHVRSLIMYGAELLTKEERKPIMEVDDELIRRLMKWLLNLKSIAIAEKQKRRIQLLLGIPTINMELDKPCFSRVNTWSKRAVDERRKVSFYATQSIEDVQTLAAKHPLREALKQEEEGVTIKSLRAKQWKELE